MESGFALRRRLRSFGGRPLLEVRLEPVWYLRYRCRELRHQGSRPGSLSLRLQAASLLAICLTIFGMTGVDDSGGSALAGNNRRPIEVASLRNANSNTLVNGDGTFTTNVYAQPVNFRDAAGHWRPIEAKFGAASQSGFEWQSGANSFSVDFKQNADPSFIRFDPGRGSPFTLTLDGANPSVGSKQTDNELLFRNVVQQTDLAYALLPQGLKESLILHNANAGPEFKFTLTPTDAHAGLTVSKQGDGSYAFYAGGGEPVFTLEAPIVRDSASGGSQQGNANPQPGNGTPPILQVPDNSQVGSVAEGKVAMDVQQNQDGSFAITLAVDQTWLTASERVFPVVLDPTITTQADIQDGYWNTTSATSTPNISDQELYGGQDGSGATYASAVTFNMSAVPPAAKVTSAVVNLYATRCVPASTGPDDSYGCPYNPNGYQDTFDLYTITNAWSGATQWQNLTTDTTSLGNYGGSFFQSYGAKIPQTFAFNGTALAGKVQAIVNGSAVNNGFLIKKTSGDTTTGITWASSRWPDVTLAPKLTIQWSADGVQLADPTNVHSNGADLSWQRYNGGLGPYATAVLGDRPTAYWRLDDGAGSRLGVADWSGNEQNGGYTSGVTLGQPGATADGDQSMYFNGTTGYMRGGETGPLDGVTNTFTIEAWVKRANTTSGVYTIFSRGDSNQGGFRLQLTTTNQLELQGLHHISTSSATIGDTGWHYVAATKNGSSVHLYVDGVDSTGAVTDETLSAGWARVIIGSNVQAVGDTGQETFNNYFAGQIDEPAVYDHVLSSAAIAAHYSAAAQQFASFDHYEIHRSANSGFTPSPSTLVATIRDPSVQNYRDSTARPSTTFYYKIVTYTNGGASSYISNQATVTTPAAGQATVTIQAGLAGALVKATALSSSNTCAVQGGEQTIPIDASDRGLLQFDLRQIPNGSTVNSASLSLFTFSTSAATITAHRLTSDWTEGTAGSPSCDGSGASWTNRNPSVAWVNTGGDYDSTATTTVNDSGGNPRWDTWSGSGMTNLVQGWLNGSYANFGVLLKHATETGAPSLAFMSNDYSTSAALRPKLTVNYTDNSTSNGPSVGIGIQGISALPNTAPPLAGTVTLTAGASDDGQIASVQFYRDSSVAIGSPQTAAPFQTSWDTTAVGRGSHTLYAVATDDAGNQSTAPTLTVNLVNSAAPTGVAITSAAVQSGSTWSATATASDDIGVSRVDFLVDGNLVASDTSSPYTQTFDTLNPANPVYDGSHILTAQAFDADGNATVSAGFPITVANGTGEYVGAVSGSHRSTSAVTIPVGTIVPYAGSTAAIPSGWALANGAAVSRSTYSALWGIEGSSYGSGDGTTTFNLPDLRGRMPLGKTNSGTGSTLGSTLSSLDQTGSISLPNQPYSFAWTDAPANPTFTSNQLTWNGPYGSTGANNNGDPYKHNNASPITFTSTQTGVAATKGATASGTASVTATYTSGNPPYRTLNYIIKIDPAAATPSCAVWPTATTTTPTGMQAADGAAATGTLSSCLASAFAGNTPDLRGNIPLGQTVSGTGSTLNGSGGALAETASVNYAAGAGVASITPSPYSVNLTVSQPAPSTSYTMWSVIQNAGTYGYGTVYSPSVGSNDGSVVASNSVSLGALNTTGASGSGTSGSYTAPYLALNYTAATTGTFTPPAGLIGAYPSNNTAPSGWLKADGSCYSTDTYPDLFTAIGYAYGGSGGSFCLPDLRGRLPLGKAITGGGSTLGATGGSLDAIPSAASLPGWTSHLTIPAHTVNWSVPDHSYGMRLESLGGSGSENATYNVGANVTIMYRDRGQSNNNPWTGNTPAFGGQTVSSNSSAQTVDAAAVGAQAATPPAQNPPSETVNYLISAGATVGATTYIPNEMRYDPSAGSQDAAPIVVTLTNNSAVSWPTATTKLRARWLNPDGTEFSHSDASIGATDIAPNEVRDVPVTVQPPTLPASTMRGRFTLSFDLLDTASNTLFSTKGVQPLNRTVELTRDTPDELGLERYQQMAAIDTGVGTASLNLFNGNLVYTHSIASEPGIGLNTVAGLTYNSSEIGSVSPAGNGFSLGLSGLIPLGQHLDVHPNVADTAAGRTTKWIGFTDTDGSYHRFLGNASGSYYTAPAGVHLYLKLNTGDSQHYYGFYRPDRTAFFFDNGGWPTRTEDKEGNALVYTETTAYDGVAKQISAVTDQGGRSFNLTYYGRADTGDPTLLGKLKKLSDHLGHAWLLSYYNDGNLLALTEKGGTNSDGSYLPDRQIVFNYVNTAGTGPAIGTLAARQTPDPTTVEGSRLYSVLDYKGQETSFAYVTSAGATQWRLNQITDRAGNATGYGYSPGTSTTTVTRPLARVWTYSFDTQARVTSITDPLNEPTNIAWTSDNEVATVTEPTGRYTEYAYNANGYLTDSWDELRDHTSISYQNLPADSNDVSTNWEAGRAIGHFSRPTSVTKPQGNVVSNTETTTFSYATGADAAKDRVVGVTDVLGNTLSTTYNADGTVASETKPSTGDGIVRTTTYNSYDLNGLPTKVTDAAGGIAQAGYDVAGNPLWLQDPDHANFSGGDPHQYRSYSYYDAFGRSGRTSTPKASASWPGLLIWGDTGYDANDNVVSVANAHYGLGDSNTAPVQRDSYDSMDRPTLITGTRLDGDSVPVRTLTEYDAGGRIVRVTTPNGVKTSSVARDFATETSYDQLDRPYQVTHVAVDSNGNYDAANSRITSYCYDLAGDLRSLTGPKGYSSFTNCPAIVDPASYSYTSASYTTEYQYDSAHRQVKQIAADGSSTQASYNADGQPTSATDANGNVSHTYYDQRGLVNKTVTPYDSASGRVLTSLTEYDALGNVSRLISPRSYDTANGSGNYGTDVTNYSYDALGRLVDTTLPAVNVTVTYPTGIPSVTTDPATGDQIVSFTSSGSFRVSGSSTSMQMLLVGGGGGGGRTPSNGTGGGGGGGAVVSGTYNVDPGTYSVTVGAGGGANDGGQGGSGGSSSVSSIASAAGGGGGYAGNIGVVFSTGGYSGNGYAGGGTNTSSNGICGGWVSGGGGGNGGGGGAGYVDLNNGGGSAGSGGSGTISSITASSIYYGGGGGGGWNRDPVCGGMGIGYGGAGGGGRGGGSSYGAVAGTANTGGGGGGGTRGGGNEGGGPAAGGGSGIVIIRFHLDTLSRPHVFAAYDANGNTTMASLPSYQANQSNLSASEKTSIGYYDTGAIATQTNPGTPTTHFDYTAEGWQSMRVPDMSSAPGTIDLSKVMYWNYFPDGLLKSLSDLGGERAYYSYDANGNQTSLTEATGITQVGQTPVTEQRSFDGFDEVTKIRLPKPGASTWLATLYSYDKHGLPTSLTDNREEDTNGNQTSAGRTISYTYNNVDLPATQIDDYSTPSNTGDDERIIYTYDPTGALSTRTLAKADGSGGWTQEQQAQKTYFDNGQLKQLTNYGANNTTPIEQHALTYVDGGGVYLNGNKASDVFTQKQADGANTCSTASCTVTWQYNGRDQLTKETSTAGSGSTTSYGLDAEGNATSIISGGVTTLNTYSGQQLTASSSGGVTTYNLYDNSGNLDCVVASSWNAASCPVAGNAALLTDYVYDYKNRLANVRTYNGAGSLTDSTDYVNDPLGRVASQNELHGIGGAQTSTATFFQYLGDGDAVSKETRTGSSATVKSYVFDAFGEQLTLSDSATTARLSLLYDPHGDVSGLLDQNSTLKQNYGYTAYGQTNAAISKTASGFNANTNPYTYSGKRWDTGSSTFDMGARRYSPSAGRWMQEDVYAGARADLGLSADPLTANRYLFTGANPVGLVELDGHYFANDDGTRAPYPPITTTTTTTTTTGVTSVASSDGGSSVASRSAAANSSEVPSAVEMRWGCGVRLGVFSPYNSYPFYWTPTRDSPGGIATLAGSFEATISGTPRVGGEFCDWTANWGVIYDSNSIGKRDVFFNIQAIVDFESDSGDVQHWLLNGGKIIKIDDPVSLEEQTKSDTLTMIFAAYRPKSIRFLVFSALDGRPATTGIRHATCRFRPQAVAVSPQGSSSPTTC
jgi:RHS repeat-associated protein